MNRVPSNHRIQSTLVIPAMLLFGVAHHAANGAGATRPPVVSAGSDFRHFPLPAPVLSDPGSETRLCVIPAPRGLIVDRRGEVLAGNRSEVRDVELRFDGETPGQREDVLPACARWGMIGAVGVASPHLLASVWMPAQWVRGSGPLFLNSGTTSQTIFLRDYPLGSTASHLIGYVTRGEPEASGPVAPLESLWPRVAGRSGLENRMNDDLSGSDGLMSVTHSLGGASTHQLIIRSPSPGKTLVLTLNARMQQLAEAILAKNGRPGAFVVMDAMNGDLLVLASHPGFDPNQFVPSITADAFGKLLADPREPFFPRAQGGNYPPGSVFKPIVALAALETRATRGGDLRYRCGPTLTISGREFRNWNDTDAGYFDVESALKRSHNTWFYQAALATGGSPILAAARAFGLGERPTLEMEEFSSGMLSEDVTSQQGLANLSIGQGNTLVSPVQMARAMAGFANKTFLPKPRVILQVQSAEAVPSVVRIGSVERSHLLHYPPHRIEQVRAGMKAAVNSAGGTGYAARMRWPRVYGKTGTAQWSKNGKEHALAWFTGFVEGSEPLLAFAVVCEGRLDERIFGGRVAAPMAGEWLRRVFSNPRTYHVSGSSTDTGPVQERVRTPTLTSIQPTPVKEAPSIRARIIQDAAYPAATPLKAEMIEGSLFPRS